jgi:hypothetical protein
MSRSPRLLALSAFLLGAGVGWQLRRPAAVHHSMTPMPSARPAGDPERAAPTGTKAGAAALIQRSRALVGQPPRMTAGSSGWTAVSATVDALPSSIEQIMPQLRACYVQAAPQLLQQNVELEVDLELSADPDVGTLVQADVLLDPKAQRLPPGFLDCMRGELQQVELPALEQGGHVVVRYPLVFAPQG